MLIMSSLLASSHCAVCTTQPYIPTEIMYRRRFVTTLKQATGFNVVTDWCTQNLMVSFCNMLSSEKAITMRDCAKKDLYTVPVCSYLILAQFYVG